MTSDLPVEVFVRREVMKSNLDDDIVSFTIEVEYPDDTGLDGSLDAISEETARYIYTRLGEFLNDENNGKE